jgi:hypothetical protein
MHQFERPTVVLRKSGLIIASITRKTLDNVCGQNVGGIRIYGHHFALSSGAQLCGHKGQIKDIKSNVCFLLDNSPAS